MQLGVAQARLDQFDVSLGRGDACSGLVLESMKHVNQAGEAHRKNRPVSVAVEVIDQFQNSAATESLSAFAATGSSPS